MIDHVTTPKARLNVYLDTNAVRALSKEDLAILLYASKQKIIKLYISEIVISERARQHSEAQRTKLIPEKASPLKLVAWFKQLFEDHDTTIIQRKEGDDLKINDLILKEEHYFRSENKNDLRDAQIFISAVSSLEKENTLIICNDTNLKNTFRKEGYTVFEDIKKYIAEISGNNTISTIAWPPMLLIDEDQMTTALSQPAMEFLKLNYEEFFDTNDTYCTTADKLISHLDSMQTIDSEIRKRILAYSQWFSPITKDDLNIFLSSKNYSCAIIDNNIQRLIIEGLIIDTGNHLIININQENINDICNEAMSSVMNEILEIMGLG